MYAPGCSIQRLAELQVPGTGRPEAGGGWRVSIQRLAELQAPGTGRHEAASGGWRVVDGWRRMVAEIMTSVDIIV